MTDVWQQLKENLVGEGRSVETMDHTNAHFTFNMVKASIFHEGELVACITLVDNGTQAEFKAAKKQLPDVLEQAGFKPHKQAKNAILNALFYQKPDDPRRAQKIMALGKSKIDEISAVLQDKQFTTAEIIHGYSGTVDGTTVNGYQFTCKGANGEKASVDVVRKSTSVIQADLDQLFQKYGWSKTAQEIDPRGGMQGNIDYARS